MSQIEKTNLDGNTLTTLADDDDRTLDMEQVGNASLDAVLAAIDDQLSSMTGTEEMPERVSSDTATGVTDDQPVMMAGTEEKIECAPLDAVTVVTDDRLAMMSGMEVMGDTAGVENVTANLEGSPMVVNVDPATCSFSSSVFVSADEAALVGSPPSLDAAVVAVPPVLLTPENKEEEEEISVINRKVVGRRQAVVDDDDDSQSSASAMSAEKDTSLASSSKSKRKGFKRGRRIVKDEDYVKESTTRSESIGRDLKKRKGRKLETRVTPEEEDSEGKAGEPKGIIEQALEELTSSVLGAAIVEWANKIDEIRVKSKNIQGKLSGEIKRCVTKIKEGATLLAIRSEATGDPHFLRMRNSELASQLREMERENARLEEQLRRASPKISPPRKKRLMKMEAVSEVACSSPVDSSAVKMAGAASSTIREAFPPLPQRSPRGTKTAKKGGGDLVTKGASTSFVDPGGSANKEMGMEVYFNRRINTLVIARDREIERQRKEELRKTQTGLEEGKLRDGTSEVGNLKVGPTIISDVQLMPPRSERPIEGGLSSAVSEIENEWRVVAGGGRGGRRRGRFPRPPPLSLPTPTSLSGIGTDSPAAVRGTVATAVDNRLVQRPLIKQLVRARPPRPPRSSAVTITGKVEGFSYASALKNARDQIDLKSLGIQTTRVRKAINGGLLIEVPGEDSKAKAEELVARLRGVLKDSAIVSCPTKKREIRVVGFDESVTVAEIMEALSEAGGCSPQDIKLGPIRLMNNGLGMVWAQLSAAAAIKVAELGRLCMGWTMVRVELLKTRPLQCFRCWAFGHVQNTCRSIVDRRGACFNCGQKGHIASACGNPARCAVCFDAGLEASHRLGGLQCATQAQQDSGLADRRTRMSTRANV